MEKCVSLQPVSEKRTVLKHRFWKFRTVCRLRRGTETVEFIDNNGKDNEVKERVRVRRGREAAGGRRDNFTCRRETRHPVDGMRKIHLREANKGGRRMPRLPEAKKDAASCENARGTASRYRSVRVRMGQPGRREACHTHYEWANAGN